MRAIGRLTSNKIRNAKPKADGKPVVLCDGGGLWLNVSLGKDGQINRSWVFRYAAAGTKVSASGREYRRERQMGLGSLDTIGLADRPALNPDGSPMVDVKGEPVVLPGARSLAAQARALLALGKDPLDERDAGRKRAVEAEAARRKAVAEAQSRRKTFDDAAVEYLKKFDKNWKSQAHVMQWRSTLREFISPILGDLDVKEIDTDQVLAVLHPIWERIPETASRVRGRIETVLNFAGRNGDNPARWKGHLEYKLAERNKARTVEHLPALPYDQVAAFMRELRAVDSIAARALEFTVLCATRRGETLGATWNEVDFATRTWTIPASRTKRDKQHVVPLSDAAMVVLDAMAAVRHDDRVFPVGNQAMLFVLKNLRPGVTVHGFRATFRSWAGGCTMHPRDVCETALGHSIGNAVELAYMRDALLAKRRVLMRDWAEFCERPEATITDIAERLAATG